EPFEGDRRLDGGQLGEHRGHLDQRGRVFQAAAEERRGGSQPTRAVLHAVLELRAGGRAAGMSTARAVGWGDEAHGRLLLGDRADGRGSDRSCRCWVRPAETARRTREASGLSWSATSEGPGARILPYSCLLP